MEPQPQLQPIAPRPQLEFAEPTGRPLELKPGPRPLDLRPRPSTRPQLDIKYGPASPAEAAAQRANPLGNPLNVVKPVVNNPLGYAPGKGLVSAAAAIAQAATDPATFGVPSTTFDSGFGPLGLPSPEAFSPDAIGSGPEVGRSPIDFDTSEVTLTKVSFSGLHLDGTGNPDAPYTGGVDLAGYQAAITVNLGSTVVPDKPEHRYGIEVKSNGLLRAFWNAGVGFKSVNLAGVAYYRTPNEVYTPPGDAPIYAPNPARSGRGDSPLRAPAKRPAPITAPRTAPGGFREGAPAPGEGFIPYTPATPAPEPTITPARPGQPEEPRKLPPVPTIPQLPGGDTDTPSAPTKRPPPVEFPPVAPGTTGRELNPPKLPPLIPIFIPPLRRDDCATGDELAREARRIRDLIRDILDKLLDDCKDLCGEAQLTRAFCEEINGELVPRQEFLTYDTLAPALGFLSREIAALKVIADPCGAEGVESVPPAVLGSGSMIEGATVAYVGILPEVRQVELIITGQIPNSLRLYDSTLSGEQQAKFGAITLAYPGVTGGNAPDAFHQWAWTRRTSFYVGPPIRNDRRIRINLKSGLTWVLYDTGLRS